MRKLSVLFSLLAALALVSIAAAQDLSAVDPNGQTVVYWHQFTNAQAATMDALVADFNATNEYGITVEATFQGNYGEIRELMNAAIISGELPNIVAGYANDAASYAKDGAVVDLAAYLGDATFGMNDDMMADFQSALIDINTIDGQVLAFPHQFSAQVFAVNNTLLAELGYDAAPATIEAFKEVACASANATGANGEDLLGFPITTDASAFESFVAAQGGSIYTGEAFDFQNEVVLATLQMYKDLYDQGCAYIPAERFAEQADFANGLTPFIVTSTAGFTFINQAFVDSGYAGEWAVAAFPHSTEAPVVQVFVPSIIMVAGTPEQQLASWLFLSYLVKAESAAKWSAGTGYFNPVPSTAAMVSEMEADFTPGLFPYFNAANELVNGETTALYGSPSVAAYGAVRGVISEAIANVTSNGMAVEEAAATLQAAADQAVADSQ